MTNDIVTENVQTAIAALERGEDVLLQDGDLAWLRQILREPASAPICSHPHVVLMEGTMCMLCSKTWVSSTRPITDHEPKPAQCVFRTGCVNGQRCIDAGYCTHGAEMLDSMRGAENREGNR